MTWVNIFNLPVLFFVFGVFAKLIRSNLEIPEPIVKAVTLYLMMAIGVKGGLSLVEAPSLTDAAAPIIIVILASFIVPTYVYWSLKRIVGTADAASIGATYGSNSTMTFVTAAAFLNTMNVPYGGYMTVALVVMETPAIIYSIFLYNRSGMATTWVAVRDALIDGTQLLLIGSLVIGLLGSYVTQDTDMLTGFISGDIFTGMIGFFLLYMGLKVGENLRDNLRQLLTPFLGLFACFAPWLNGAIGFALAWAFGLDAGDGLLVTILCASSSYIVAPAIIPYAIPQANIGRFLTMSIGITFPINILIGIPVWWALCEQVLM